MPPPTPRRAPSPRAVALVLGTAWFVGLTAVLALLDGFLAQVPMARAVLGALIVSIAVDRAGARHESSVPFTESVVPAFVLGALVFLIPLGIAVVTGRAQVAWVSPGTMLVISLAITFARAFETEMLLRVLSFEHASRAALPLGAWLAFATIASPAKAGLLVPLLPIPLALSAALGFAAAILHAQGRDPRRNIAFTMGFAALAGPLAQGGILEVKWTAGELRPDALASGLPAILAAIVAVLGAALLYRHTARRRRAPESAAAER